MSKFTTKVTRTQDGYFCRVLKEGQPVVQTKVKQRIEIGPAFRDLLRTLDQGGGDAFTSSARTRGNKEGAARLSVKHEWLKNG